MEVMSHTEVAGGGGGASPSGHDGPRFKSPRHAQVWFLFKSRGAWKRKYMELKSRAKRLQNQVADVCKSREQWRQSTERLREQVAELEAENARLKAGSGGKRIGGHAPGG